MRLITKMTNDERKELEALRLYKEQHQGRALTRAFANLESLMDCMHDPIISRRAFRVIGECLIALKQEMGK